MISRILETKRQEVETLDMAAFGPRRKPVLPLVCDGPVNIIAELKRKSPSAGYIGEVDRDRVRAYARYAKAISVVTDRTYFGGSLQFLAEVAEQTCLPILCKDFIIDRRQIDLAYAAGADVVLLIARVLGERNLGTLYTHALDLGLACLVELHDAAEIAMIGGFAPPILGVNARDLDTLAVDLDNAARLLTQIEAPVRVAESGIKSRKEIERMKGANAFLIGEALMRSSDVASTFEGLLYGKN